MIAAEKIKQRKRDNSLRDLWRTPDWLFSAIQRYLGVTFDVDVACNKDNAKLPNFIGIERATEYANETIILSGGRVAFVEPDVNLGQVEVNINPGGSMLVVFRGFCQDAGHSISKIPLDVMKSLGGYDPANVIRKKRPSKKAA